MTVALWSYKVDPDGVIRVAHVFYGETEEQCEALMEQHAEGCRAFGPALEAGETIEEVEDDAEQPDAEELREDEADEEEEEGDATEAD